MRTSFEPYIMEQMALVSQVWCSLCVMSLCVAITEVTRFLLMSVYAMLILTDGPPHQSTPVV